MRRSKTEQKSGSWSHMEIDLTNKNTDLQRIKNSSCRHGHHFRSNSFCSFACRQNEQMAGTIQLFYLYEDKNVKNNSKKRNRRNSTIKQKYNEIHLNFIDLPIGHVKIKNLNNWDFNIFHLRKMSSNYTMRDIGLQVMNEYDLFHKLKLDYFMMARIFSSIEAAYHNFNPYHTALHAADVLQAIHCFILQSNLLALLSPVEILTSLLAAALHDADHPGVNQSYLEKTRDFLVDLYKSVSVLEKHHAKVGLCILKENGLSEALELQDWRFLHDWLLKLIPATDITYQGVYRKQFIELTNYHVANPLLPYTLSDRLLIMQMALKCSDISNPCRIWPICKKWAKRVCSELFCQGDRERFQWLLQPIPTMDRTKFSLARVQIVIKISDEKCKIDLPKLFTVSFHSTTSPIKEIETLNTCETINSNNYNLKKLQQTIFITTRAMRRHSLPETQLAIRKTFNISLSKKPSTIVLLKNNASTMLSIPSRDNDNNISMPSSKIKFPLSTVKSSSSSSNTTATTTTCTPSANILHMLCEELNNNKTNYSSSRIDSKSIPNTFYCKDNQLLDEKVFDLNREQTFLRFSALAHRRSSAPITEH
ncbi:hypothetical protein MN116_001860 [Schistosoma mekongi]|uniref:PDEase domain-containing protein n=1 Tax=Schistosoma mekongi TaxID=38744 RepID=A0AAE1ZJ08_SCHME|nr:hypothetical protein MN116_001860 [Schistosoma mekongi]